MLLMPEIIAINILNVLFIIFASIAFFMSLKILLNWNRESTTPLQYKLEKESYLASTIIRYIFYIKVPLLMFFIYFLDKLSFSIPGAMCATGVINAESFGVGLLFLKILNIYLFAYWIVLDKEDMKYEREPYFKQKFYLYLIFFLLFIVEIVLESDFFYSLDIKSVVDCCGTLFSVNEGTYISLILNQPTAILLTLFYINYILLIVTKIAKQKYLFSILNILFLFSSLITLIVFFGTYIYELPTHHCPFCMLQKEYHYIGYFLYLFLFIGTFNGAIIAFLEFDSTNVIKKEKLSLFFNTLYVFIITLYVVSYYIKNGLLL